MPKGIDGGYATHMIANKDSLARIPEGLTDVEAAPLLCAGVTTFNALRHSSAIAGAIVAVNGIGGLGHLAVQFAAKMGYNVVALSRGADKKELALSLGAKTYVDTNAENAVEVLNKMGGAKVIIDTSGNVKVIESLIGVSPLMGSSFWLRSLQRRSSLPSGPSWQSGERSSRGLLVTRATRKTLLTSAS
jgi:D-arabinose 1-dehydrogenase-like Zn-dependent alcohol dehydrogenase